VIDSAARRLININGEKQSLAHTASTYGVSSTNHRRTISSAACDA
jgi:hypothetical protein